MTTSIVIAGGGTGGHVYPGLALAAAIRRREPEAAIVFVGTSRGMETRAVPAAGYELTLIDVLPFAKTIGSRRFLAPMTAIKAAASARRLLRSRRAGVVASMGGYASLPVALAARSLGVPIVLHEQNAIPGRANLVTARLTSNIAVTFAESRARFPHPSRVRVVGNPVRSAIARMDRSALRAEAMTHFDLDPARATLLITGGSQGARRLNEAAPGMARRWASRRDRQILLIAGPGNSIVLDGASRSIGATDRMDLAYAAADLVLCRSGAGVCEVACAGLPSLLVPYPYARDDHQRANAAAFVAAGAAKVIADADATDETLTAHADAILDDEFLASAMAAAARSLARPDAADDLAEWVLRCAGGTSR